MVPPQSTHPDDHTLEAYGLGKLIDQQASTVNDHLEGCPDCRQRLSGLTSDSFLDRFREAHQPSARSIPAGSMVDGTFSYIPAKVASPPPLADTLPPGLTNHPDYEIKRELGRGGMGVVYLAHNAMMGRDEVLKVMGRHIMERPGVLERFQREIRAVAKLRHPNIVAAHSAFRIEGGLVFAMEYVEGLDLARLVKAKGPLSVPHAAYFVHQAALGLQHAHEKGLIHRDIKPHNLMLTHDGKARVVKVLDFGLAKATREEKVEAGLTSEGQALGTPDYIAPEQIVNALDVDIRADLYSLGGTLFYLLTGRPPFQCTSLYDIYQAHMSRDAESLNLIRPEVPAELAALVAKMMDKEPGRRFQTPAEVAQALMPYFKRVSSSPRSSQGEISLPVLPIAPKPAAVEQHRVPPRKATEPIESQALWNSLIEDRAPEPLMIQLRASAIRQRPPWASKTMIVAATLFILVTLGVIIITIKRDNGRELKITLESTWPGKTIPEPIQREIPTPETKVVKEERTSEANRPYLAGGLPGPGMTGGERPDEGVMGKAPEAVEVPAANEPRQVEVNLPPIKAAAPASPDSRDFVVGGDWQLEQGNLIQRNTDSNNRYILLGDQEIEQFDLNFKAKVVKGTRYLAIFRYTGPRDYWVVESDRKVTTLIWDPAGDDEGVTQVQLEFNRLQEYAMRIEVRKSACRVFRDGKQVLAYERMNFGKGRIGLGTWQSIAIFRDIELKTPDGKTIWTGPPKIVKAAAGDHEAEKVPEAEKLPGTLAGVGVAGKVAGAPPAIVQAAPGTAPAAKKIGRNHTSQYVNSARIAALAAALKKRVPMNYPDGVPLSRLIEDIKKATKGSGDSAIPIYPDPIGIEEADKTLDSIVRIHMEGQPLERSLRLALRPLGLDYFAEEGLLTISSRDEEAGRQVGRVVGVPNDGTAESKAVLAFLERPIPMRFPKGLSIREGFEFIRKAMKESGNPDITAHVDPNGVEDADKTINSRSSIDLEGIPLRISFRLWLGQMGLGYYVKEGILTISAREVFPPEFK